MGFHLDIDRRLSSIPAPEEHDTVVLDFIVYTKELALGAMKAVWDVIQKCSEIDQQRKELP